MEEFKRFVKEFLWDEELLQSDAATEDDDDEEENGKGGEDEDSSSSGPDDDSAFGRLATANVRRPPSPQLLGNDDMRKLADFGRTLKALDSQSSGGGQGESKRRQQTETNKAEAAETTQPSSEENDDDDVEVQVPRFARYAGGAKDIAKPAPAVSVHAHAVAAATAEPEIQVPRFARYSGGAKVTAAATKKAPAVKAPAVQAAVVKAEGAEGAEETEVAEEADGAVELCLDFEIVLPAGRKLGMTLTHNTTHAVRGKIGCKVTHVDEGGAAVEAAGQICKKCLETKCDKTCPGVPSIIPHDWVIGVNGTDVSDDPKDDVVAVIKAAMATGEPVTMRFRRSEESEAARVAIYLHARSVVLAGEMKGTDRPVEGETKEGGRRRRSLGAGIVESDVRDTIRPPYALGTCVQVYYVTRTLETNVGATTGWLHCGFDEEGGEGWYRGTVATLADQVGRQRIEFDDGESDWFDLTLTRHEMDPVHRHHERLAKMLDSSSSVALSTSSGRGIERMSTAGEAMQELVAEEERKKTASLSASASASTSAAAPTVAPPATTSAPPYAMGTRVAVKYQNDEWFCGVVATDVDKERRQRVHFDDGDVDLFDLRHAHHAVVQAALFANPSDATLSPHQSQMLKTRLQSRLREQDALLSASDHQQKQHQHQHQHQQVERVHQDLMRELDAIVGKRDAVESTITYVSASVDKATVGVRVAVLWDYGDGDSSWYVVCYGVE